MKKLYPLFIILAIIASSCKTAYVSIEVLKPAEISIPGDHEKITVINRSLPGKGHKGGNFVEGLFSGEGIHQDKNASYNCVRSFALNVNEAPKYLVNFAEDFELDGVGGGKWPLPIHWDSVRAITDYYDTDILIALETFDSDSRRYSDSRSKDDGVEYLEGIQVTINAGWRIYDPENETIIDQNNFIDHKIWEDTDNDLDDAKRGIPSKRNAVDQAGTYAGFMYAKRVSPTWQTESRVYFKTRDPQMKLAHNYVRQRNWKEAYEIWYQLKTTNDNKIAAYSLHNLAVYHEFNDDIEMALESANEAYSKYPNEHTLRYINVLTFRQSEINRLNDQLNN